MVCVKQITYVLLRWVFAGNYLQLQYVQNDPYAISIVHL